MTARRLARSGRRHRPRRLEHALLGSDVRGKQLLLVGFGRIGREVAARALACKMRVCAFDVRADLAPMAGVERVATLADGLARADVVSLHVDLNPSTRHLLDDAAFAVMKPNAIVINTSRGGVVDQAALTRALVEAHRRRRPRRARGRAARSRRSVAAACRTSSCCRTSARRRPRPAGRCSTARSTTWSRACAATRASTLTIAADRVIGEGPVSYPNVPDKHADPVSLYTPADFLGWAQRAGWDPGPLPVGVVFTFQPFVTNFLADHPERFVENFTLAPSNARVFLTNDDDALVGVSCLNPGATTMVSQIENLLYLGDTRRFVTIGTAGALVPDIRIADTCVLTAAVRDDGISQHYLRPRATWNPPGR